MSCFLFKKMIDSNKENGGGKCGNKILNPNLLIILTQKLVH